MHKLQKRKENLRDDFIFELFFTCAMSVSHKKDCKNKPLDHLRQLAVGQPPPVRQHDARRCQQLFASSPNRHTRVLDQHAFVDLDGDASSSLLANFCSDTL